MNGDEQIDRTKDLDEKQSRYSQEMAPDNLLKELSFLKAIENAIPSGIAVVDEAGRQTYVNKAFCNMLGWKEEELLDKYPPYIYWFEKDADNINEAFRKTLNNEAPKEGFDLLFRHKSGMSIPVNVNISPLKQENSKMLYLANVIDITERKKAEKELQKSQLLLIASLEGQKNTIIFFVDKDYKYIYFNKAHRDGMKYAYNVDIEPGMNMIECMSIPEDQKATKETIDRGLRGESFTYLNEFGTVNRDYYEVLVNPIINEKNQIIGCSGLTTKITERILAEKALRDSETKFKEIIDQINDIIMVFDEKGEIIIWNKGAENTLGLKAEEALNRRIADIQYQLSPPHLKDRDVIEKGIEAIVSMKMPELFNQTIDSEIMTPGHTRPRNIQTRVFPVKLDGNHLFCSVIRDTTETKRYEREMVRISSEKDKFYSTLAQYLYTPFNVFNNFSKLMAEDLENLPIKEIQKMAMMMSKSATNLYSLLDNLLQWTRVNQGKINYEPQKLNLKKVCQDALSVLKPDADVKNITINHFEEDNVNVNADIFMLKTIFRNLLINAMKYTDNNGHIDIKASPALSDVLISIRYEGAGISSDHMSKFFDISNINTSIKDEDEKGTSLGLLLSKELVEKHGGRIWVARDKNTVSIFNFTLPSAT
jgi:PAS domain S-box-containing protein